MQDGIAAALSQLIADPARVLTAPATLDRLSHDFYWYSPILRPQLAAKKGDVAVQPVSADEVLAVMRNWESRPPRSMCFPTWRQSSSGRLTAFTKSTRGEGSSPGSD